MGALTNWGVGCCCGGNISGHCDSDSFDSSCSDEGQGYPLSYAAGCNAPTRSGMCDIPVYTNVDGMWQWVVTPKLFAENCLPITDETGTQISA